MQNILDFLAANPLLAALLLPVLVGLLGTLLESLGERFKIPALVAVGQQN